MQKVKVRKVSEETNVHLISGVWRYQNQELQIKIIFYIDQGHRIFPRKATKLNQNHKIINLGNFIAILLLSMIEVIQWLVLSGKRNKLANILSGWEVTILNSRDL